MDRTELINRIYDARQRRIVHPRGRSDKSRWYPSDWERCGCCDAIRNPSRAYPWSYMIHCRTRSHIAHLVNRHSPSDAVLLAQAELGKNRERRAAVEQSRACADGIAYKALAQVEGQLVSIFDGSPWPLGVERREIPHRDHNGGYYVYKTVELAACASVPSDSRHADAPRAIARCEVGGSYCRYDGGKLAFGHVRPLEIVSTLKSEVAHVV